MSKRNYEIKNDNFRQTVIDSFAHQSIIKTLGATLSRVESGYCEISMPYNSNSTQQHGYLHAGVVSTIADSAAGYAAFTLSPPQSSVLTTEFKINLLSPAKGESFIAKANVIKAGKTLQIVLSEVFSIESNEEKLCAVLLATIMTMNKPDISNTTKQGFHL